MFEKTKKKLIHFNTSGNIAEDFTASKKKKSERLRAWIRLCFFCHIFGGTACAAVGYVLSRENFFTLLVCVVIEAVIAFFAAGGEMTTKAALVGIDLILAAAGTIKAVSGSENERVLFFIFGGAAIVGAVLAVAEMIAAHLRDYLRDFPAEKLKQEDITPVEIRSADQPSFELKMNIINSIERKKMPPTVIPEVGEMRRLAAELNSILNGASAVAQYKGAEINIEDSDKLS